MSAFWFSRWAKRPIKPARPSPPRRRVKPQLEALEDRWVPSIDMVTNLSGSAAVPGSLPYWVANATPGDTIQFAPNLTGGTITLGSTLEINQGPGVVLPWFHGKDLTIDGRDNHITVNGGGNQVFVIDQGVVAQINALTITGGDAGISGTGLGGGIDNHGILSLSNSTVTGNSALGAGGGIYNEGTGTMTMTGDTVNNNVVTSVTGWGGGIYNACQLTIIDSTIANNTAGGGAGISNIWGVLNMANCTVAYNIAAGGAGGGIYTYNAPTQLSLLNTIVFNPNSGAAENDNVAGTITQAQGSLFGSTVTIPDFGGDMGGNQQNVNPLLGPLQDNGGPTATMALQSGSMAIGHGAFASLISGLSVPTTDQRGDPRPAITIDIGAFQKTSLTPHQQFVEALYTDFLHRTGDVSNPGDAGHWVTLLNQGTPAAAVAGAIARSGEGLGVAVDGLYQRFLGRAADAPGRAGFVGYLQSGGTLEGVSQMMLASPEYQSHFPTDSAFVQSLYQNLLYRTASSAEVNGWVAQLPQRGRAGVAKAFLISQEFRADEVGDDYIQLLDRTQPASTAEVNSWVGSGKDLLTIDTLFAASPEFQMNG